MIVGVILIIVGLLSHNPACWWIGGAIVAIGLYRSAHRRSLDPEVDTFDPNRPYSTRRSRS